MNCFLAENALCAFGIFLLQNVKAIPMIVVVCAEVDVGRNKIKATCNVPRSYDVDVLKTEIEASFPTDCFSTCPSWYYYRLSVFPLTTPPLRSRIDNIVLLTKHFLRQSSRRLNLPLPKLTEKNIADLKAYRWPGNVRELQNVVERSIILSRSGAFHLDLPTQKERPNPSRSEPPSLTRSEFRELERENIKAALKKSGGKIYGRDGAAEILGMNPTTLASRITVLGIQRNKG